MVWPAAPVFKLNMVPVVIYHYFSCRYDDGG